MLNTISRTAWSLVVVAALTSSASALAQVSSTPITTVNQSQAVTVVNTEEQPANVRLAQEPAQINVFVPLYNDASASNISGTIPAGYTFVSSTASVRVKVAPGDVPELWISGFLNWFQSTHYVALTYQGRSNGYDMWYANVPLMIVADGGTYIRVNATRTTAAGGAAIANVQLGGYLIKNP